MLQVKFRVADKVHPATRVENKAIGGDSKLDESPPPHRD